MATKLRTYTTEGPLAPYDHIASHLNDYELARSNFFKFIPNPNLAQLPKATYKGEIDEVTDADRLGKAAIDAFELNITKAAVPQFTIGQITYDRGNEKIKAAGLPEWSEGSITVDDIVGVDTKGTLLAWKYAAWNPYTRKGGRMKNYKFDCNLVEYTQDYQVIRSWTLFGCWISAFDDAEFDRGAGDGRREMSVTLQYDRAELDIDDQDWDAVPNIVKQA